MNLEENGPIIKVDHNGDTLKIEVNDDILDSSADQNQFLSSDIGEEENVDLDQLENFCSLCEKQFNSLAGLELHLQTIHTNNSEIETNETNTSITSENVKVEKTNVIPKRSIFSDYFDITITGQKSAIRNDGSKRNRPYSKAVCLTCGAEIHSILGSNSGMKYHAEKVHNIKLGTNPEDYYSSLGKKNAF